MSTIVRYRKSNGSVALYESTSHYDPVTKQSRPIRKYLGIEDPETEELIPTTGKPGHPKKNKEEGAQKETDANKYERLYREARQELDRKEALIRELREEITAIKAKQRKQEQTVQSVRKMLEAIVTD